jgi:murein DD-endopeptidase MepM/ murein hydrolase activator NlpD
LARLFPERQILLRTGSRRCCFTVSTRVQTAVATVAAAITVWQGIVTTRWLDSAATIAVKDYQIVDLRVDREAAIESKSDLERRFRELTSRISTEMEDIERNLALLAHHDRITSRPLAAYTAANAQAGGRLRRPLDAQLARLEGLLSELQERHSDLLVTSAQTASAQLDRLESALTAAGVDTETLATEPRELCSDDEGPPAPSAGEDVGRGGPFVPVDAGSHGHENPRRRLHATMQRWNDVVIAIGNLPLGRPVENMRVSSTFGRRRDPFNHRQAVHHGIDYAGASNVPVVATGSGVVKFAGRNGRYGKLVEIDHGHGFVTRYAHLADISVAAGQHVERGTQVGLVGSTGRSTGPHLHYELRVGNQPRDPLKFIEVGKNVFKRNSTEVGPG